MNNINLCDFAKAKVYLWKTENTNEKLFLEVSNKIRSLYEKINYDDLFHHLYNYIKYINNSNNELFLRHEVLPYPINGNRNSQQKEDHNFFKIFKNPNYVKRNGNISIDYIDLFEKNLEINKINFFSNVFISIGIHELSDSDFVTESFEDKEGNYDSISEQTPIKDKTTDQDNDGNTCENKKRIHNFFKIRKKLLKLINSYNSIYFNNSCVFIQRVLIIPSSDKYDEFIMEKIMEINENFLYANSTEAMRPFDNNSFTFPPQGCEKSEGEKGQPNEHTTTSENKKNPFNFNISDNVQVVRDSPYYDKSNLDVDSNKNLKNSESKTNHDFEHVEKKTKSENTTYTSEVDGKSSFPKITKKYSSTFLKIFNKNIGKEYMSLNARSPSRSSESSDEGNVLISEKEKQGNGDDNLDAVGSDASKIKFTTEESHTPTKNPNNKNSLKNKKESLHNNNSNDCASNSDVNNDESENKKDKELEEFSFISNNIHNFKIIIFLPSVKKHFSIQYNKFLQAIILNIFYIYIFFLYDLLTKKNIWDYMDMFFENLSYEITRNRKDTNESTFDDKIKNTNTPKKINYFNSYSGVYKYSQIQRLENLKNLNNLKNEKSEINKEDEHTRINERKYIPYNKKNINNKDIPLKVSYSVTEQMTASNSNPIFVNLKKYYLDTNDSISYQTNKMIPKGSGEMYRIRKSNTYKENFILKKDSFYKRESNESGSLHLIRNKNASRSSSYENNNSNNLSHSDACIIGENSEADCSACYGEDRISYDSLENFGNLHTDVKNEDKEFSESEPKNLVGKRVLIQSGEIEDFAEYEESDVCEIDDEISEENENLNSMSNDIEERKNKIFEIDDNYKYKIKKKKGDIFLLLGSPLDSIEEYLKCFEICKMKNDYLYQGNIYFSISLSIYLFIKQNWGNFCRMNNNENYFFRFPDVIEKLILETYQRLLPNKHTNYTNFFFDTSYSGTLAKDRLYNLGIGTSSNNNNLISANSISSAASIGISSFVTNPSHSGSIASNTAPNNNNYYYNNYLNNFNLHLYGHEQTNHDGQNSVKKNIISFINILKESEKGGESKKNKIDEESYLYSNSNNTCYFFNLEIKQHNILLYLIALIEYKLNQALLALQKTSSHLNEKINYTESKYYTSTSKVTNSGIKSLTAQEHFCDYLICLLKYTIMINKNKKTHIFFIINKYSYIAERFIHNLYIKYYIELLLIYKHLGAFRKFAFTAYMLCTYFYQNKKYYLSFFLLNNILPFYNLPSICSYSSYQNYKQINLCKADKTEDTSTFQIEQAYQKIIYNNPNFDNKEKNILYQYINNLLFKNKCDKFVNFPMHWLYTDSQTRISSSSSGSSDSSDFSGSSDAEHDRCSGNVPTEGEADEKHISKEVCTNKCEPIHNQYTSFDYLKGCGYACNLDNLFNFCSKQISSKSVMHINKHINKLKFYEKKKKYNNTIHYSILYFLSQILKNMKYEEEYVLANLLFLLFLNKHLSKQIQKETINNIYELLNKKKHYISFPPFVTLLLDEERKKKNIKYLKKLYKDSYEETVIDNNDSKLYDISEDLPENYKSNSSCFYFLSDSNDIDDNLFQSDSSISNDSIKLTSISKEVDARKSTPKKGTQENAGENSHKNGEHISKNKLHFLSGFTEGRCAPLPILENIQYPKASHNNEKIYKKIKPVNIKSQNKKDKDIFKYNPFNEKEKNVKIQNICSTNELKNIIITLKNPLSVDIVLNNLILITSGVSIENYPTSVVLLSKKKKKNTNVNLSFKAKEPGILYVLGISYYISYLHFEQYFLYDTNLLRQYIMTNPEPVTTSDAATTMQTSIEHQNESDENKKNKPIFKRKKKLLFSNVLNMSSVFQVFVINNYFHLESGIKFVNFGKYINIESLINDKDCLANYCKAESFERRKNSKLDTPTLNVTMANQNKEPEIKYKVSVVDAENGANRSGMLDSPPKIDGLSLSSSYMTDESKMSDQSYSLNSFEENENRRLPLWSSKDIGMSRKNIDDLDNNNFYINKRYSYQNSEEESNTHISNFPVSFNQYRIEEKKKSISFENENDNIYFSTDARYEEILEGEIKFLCLVCENTSNIDVNYINVKVRYKNKSIGNQFIKFYFDKSFYIKNEIYNKNKDKKQNQKYEESYQTNLNENIFFYHKKGTKLKVQKNHTLYIPIKCTGSMLVNECEIDIIYSSSKHSSYYSIQKLNLKLNVKKNISIESILYFPYVSFNWNHILTKILNSDYYRAHAINKLGLIKQSNELITNSSSDSLSYYDISIMHNSNSVEINTTHKKDRNRLNENEDTNKNSDSMKYTHDNSDYISDTNTTKQYQYPSNENLSFFDTNSESSDSHFEKKKKKKNSENDRLIENYNQFNKIIYTQKSNLNICTDNKYIFLEIYIKNDSGYVNYCKSKKLKRRPTCVVDKDNYPNKWIIWIKRLKRKQNIIFKKKEDILKYFLLYIDYYVSLTYSRHKKMGILSSYSSYLNHIYINKKKIEDFFLNFKTTQTNKKSDSYQNDTTQSYKQNPFSKIDTNNVDLYSACPKYRSLHSGQKQQPFHDPNNTMNSVDADKQLENKSEDYHEMNKKLSFYNIGEYLQNTNNNNCYDIENGKSKLLTSKYKLFENNLVNDLFYPYILLEPEFQNCKKRNTVIIPSCSRTLNFTNINKIGIKKNYFETGRNEFFLIKIWIRNMSSIDLGQYTLFIFPSNLNCIKIIGTLNKNGYLTRNEVTKGSKKNNCVEPDNMEKVSNETKHHKRKQKRKSKVSLLHSLNAYSLFPGKVFFYIAIYFHNFHTLLFHHEPILVTIV
ncbi:conserved Plasmodium protein, unknown function [Plasmodium chabaudi chabaudi]|uniref:Trs120/TRAPPC9 first Ig-like domain-containing protein n=1 Tax=Plasmodium chabaudi chabaudi TaxID=31271 RepID=A0A1D3RSF0_PLACU|nr:conserved Plasmodium protein, unknown function [Plasmodium chabaudi chabaudi]